MNDDYENPDDDDQEEEDDDDEDEQDEEEDDDDEEDDDQDEEDAVDDDDKWQQIWTLNRHGPTWRYDVRSTGESRTCHRRAGLGIAHRHEARC